jgi:opacity protein-like surface antigen
MENGTIMRSPRVSDAYLALCLASTFASGSVARAQRPSNTWRWSITPYVWAAGTNGRVGARDVVGSVDVTTGDVLQTGALAFMAALEGRRGRWLSHLDAFYVSTTDDEDLGPVLGKPSTLHIEQYQTMLAPHVGYSAFIWPKATVHAIAGLRYWHVKAELTAVLPSMSSGAETSADWADGIVGADVRATPWGPRWHLLAYADLGAGGSDFTWQALGGATYDLSRCCSIGLIYRHLDVDYESDRLVNDVAMGGPALSFGVRF